MDAAVILPCPLLRRAVIADPMDWLRADAVYATLPADKPRIVLAHGSIQGLDRAEALHRTERDQSTRLERVREELRELDLGAPRGLQIIVLSCNPSDYAASGTRQVNL